MPGMTTPGSVLSAHGQWTDITLDGGVLVISKRLPGRKAQRQIPVGSITAVDFRPAGRVGRGFFRVIVAGGFQHETPAGSGSRASDAVGDPNGAAFNRKQQAGFEAIRDALADTSGRS